MRPITVVLLLTELLLSGSIAGAEAETGVLLLAIREAGAPVAARVHLIAPDGKPVPAPKPGADVTRGLPYFHDHFDCRGELRIALAPGRYRYEVERGPEYARVRGAAEIERGKTREVVASLRRIAHLARRGWWSGELHVHRALEDMPTLLEAEDLHFAPVLTVWNQSSVWRGRELPADRLVAVGRDRAYDVLGCEDERGGGALLYYRLSQPLDFRGDGREHPSPLVNLERARAAGAWIDIEKPFWWDVPTWVASGHIDSIGVANNHMCRSTMYASEAWGRPRDTGRLPPPRGNGFWTQELYYRLLDCGFRIPPSAGSASGVLPNPVGYNRAYVYLEDGFSPERWWRGLRAGRSFVTNGPLLLATVDGQRPGATLRLAAGETRELGLAVELAGNDPLEVLEVVVNGRVVRRVENPPKTGRPEIAPLRITEPGWVIVRVIAAVPHTFRFASTAPFWVEQSGASRRVDPEDVDFFIAWIGERMKRIERTAAQTIGALDDPENARKLASVLAPHERALAAFRALLDGRRD